LEDLAGAQGHGWRAEREGSTSRVILSGDWVARVDGVEAPSADRILDKGVKGLTFETSGLGHWDSALIAFLSDLTAAAKRGGVSVDEGGLPKSAGRLLALMSGPAAPAAVSATKSVLERVGRWTESMTAQLEEGSALVGNLVLRGALGLRGKAAMRGGDLVSESYDAGLSALPIVTVVNLLVGAILAFIGATELRTFGAGTYVANLVGIGMVREMAALMTAIIMAGRTGGAYAANIAAMQAGEEIDALRAFGIPVFDYLVLPKIVALTAMMPILYLYGCAVGIVGGLVVGAATLGVSPVSFFIHAREALSVTQLGLGLAKSFAFGVLIALVACRVGLRAGRGAADVGKAATDAVVAGIVGVIALDAVFDVCADVLRI
jgi:phospholipid/cholesterol/gamma-HCH transport system permease protein